MIGKLEITAELQPKTADRDDFIIKAIGPGSTDYSFPIFLTGTILAVWQEHDSKSAAMALAEIILGVVGTATAPPSQGFWFDSYNSSDSLKQTLSDIQNGHLRNFIKNITPSDIYGRLMGDEVWSKVEEIDKFFIDKYKIPFFKSLENAFENSQVLDDLNNPPDDNANYLYRICILSGIIDHISIEPSNNIEAKSSLQKFKIWLNGKLGEPKAKELVDHFQMVKNLRKQYPIHDHFETISGIRKIRKEIIQANSYFNIIEPKSYGHNWGIILNSFGVGIQSIISELTSNI
jgi:hypothetical protein